MSIICWCNLKLEGKKERLFGGNLILKDMTDALEVPDTVHHQTVARTILGWSWFAEHGIYGPLMMFIPKTTATRVLRIQYKSNIGKFVKWLKDQSEHELSAEMKEIYSLMIKGFPSNRIPSE